MELYKVNNDLFIATCKNYLGIQKNGVKKWFCVEDDPEYTFKLLKTKIKAQGGASGLFCWLKECYENNFQVCNADKVINYCFSEMHEAKY